MEGNTTWMRKRMQLCESKEALTVGFTNSTVAYKQAALNAIAYLNKVR